MRRGTVYRRCGRCKKKVEGKRCPCGGPTSWTFTVDISPPGMPRRQVRGRTYQTKDAALEALNQLQSERRDRTYVEPSKITVREFLERWVGSLQVRPTTQKNYDVAVRVHIVPRIGDVPLQQLDRTAVKTLYATLRNTGYAKGTRAGTGLSAKSVHNVHLTLEKALADAVTDGLLRTNPATAAHSAPGDHERPEMLTWSREELRRFLEVEEGRALHPLWRLLASTGMRRGEALGLRWRDLDLDQGRVHVRQQLGRMGKEVGFGVPKTKAARRAVDIGSGTVEALKFRKAAVAGDKLALGDGYRDLDLVFCRPDGHPHDPDVVTHQFDLAVSRAKVRRIRLHDLRHTHATLALQDGVHPKVVQERLGHANIQITLTTYSHILPTLQRGAADQMDSLLDGAPPSVTPTLPPKAEGGG